MSFTQEDCSKMIFFVQLIEKYPCLWNYTMKSYSRTDVTSAAWNKIAAEMNETEQICRDRWKNIRTAFGRSMKLLQSRSGRLKKPYYLAHHLSFLRPYMKRSTASFNGPPLEENEDIMAASSAIMSSSDPQQTECCHTSEEISNEVDCDNLIQPPPSKRKMEASESDADKPFTNWLEVKRLDGLTTHWDSPAEASENDAEKSFANWLEMKKHDEIKRNCESPADNADWLFFQSMLPDFKKLNDRRRRYLKAKFLLLLNEQLDEAENDTS